MNELLPEIKQAIEFVAVTATGGIIGNRVDAWFVSLYYHEKQRILSWLRNWTLSEDDKRLINSDEKYKVLFSQVTSNVANEIFDQKLLIWPTVTESLLRNSIYDFDKKQFFINTFIRLDPFSIRFIAMLCFKKVIKYKEIFPGFETNTKPSITDKIFPLYLGLLQSSNIGMVHFDYDNEVKEHTISISELGTEFIDFISNSSLDKLKQMAQL